MDIIIPPLTIKILLESSPLKSRISVWRLAVAQPIYRQENVGGGSSVLEPLSSKKGQAKPSNRPGLSPCFLCITPRERLISGWLVPTRIRSLAAAALREIGNPLA